MHEKQLCKNILFYFMVHLKNDPKNRLSCVSDKKYCTFSVPYIGSNFSKTTPQELN